MREFWSRHRTLFWTLHSGWALATGIAVVLLARERYGFVPWVVGFLLVTWASTLFFGRRVEAGDDSASADAVDSTPGLRDEVTSYVTRMLYQETLFFLLPLYAHSTVVASPNLSFLVFLGGLAALSCLDLLFDRWLRTRPAFGLVFFATVAFAAINLLLPILLGVDPELATPIAAGAAVATAVPLASRIPSGGVWGRIRLGAAGVAILAVGIGVPRLVPPVPLHTERAVFATSIDPETLELKAPLGAEVSRGRLGDDLFVLFEVFAPSTVPSRVRIVWSRDGTRFRASRDVDLLAHDWGFRVWDGWGTTSGPVPAGRYDVRIQTSDGRVFGKVELRVLDARPGGSPTREDGPAGR